MLMFFSCTTTQKTVVYTPSYIDTLYEDDYYHQYVYDYDYTLRIHRFYNYTPYYYSYWDYYTPYYYNYWDYYTPYYYYGGYYPYYYGGYYPYHKPYNYYHSHYNLNNYYYGSRNYIGNNSYNKSNYK